MDRLHFILNIINNIRYKDGWKFKITPCGEHHYLTICVDVIEVYTQAEEVFYKQFFIPNHANESEILRIVFKGIVDLEIHEAQEQFQYKGKRIQIPHAQVEHLTYIADKIEESYKNYLSTK